METTDGIYSKRTVIKIGIATGIIIFLVFIITITTITNEGCSIDIIEDFTDYHPLLIKSNSLEFILPNKDSKIIFTTGESLRLACTGQDNYLNVTTTAMVSAICVSNKTFLLGSIPYSFFELQCENNIDSIIRDTGNKCAEKYTETEIGFSTNDGFVHLITTCFDEAKKDSLYSIHNLSSNINYGKLQKLKTDNFIQRDHYPNLELDDLYRFENEKKVFETIIGNPLPSLNKENYFNRGHLAAKGDFIYRSQKQASLFYENIAPQWKKFNSGNWNQLEISCRKFVSKRDSDLVVYTGVYETGKFENYESGLSLHLDENNNNILTVPDIFWKILYDPISKNGIVFISHNTPKKKYKKLCTDVCSKINWLSWKAENIALGYSYCCEYVEFKKINNYLPDIQIDALLV